MQRVGGLHQVADGTIPSTTNFPFILVECFAYFQFKGCNPISVKIELRGVFKCARSNLKFYDSTHDVSLNKPT